MSITALKEKVSILTSELSQIKAERTEIQHNYDRDIRKFNIETTQYKKQLGDYDDQLTHLQDTTEALRDENKELRNELETLIHQLKAHQRARFGSTSERFVDEDQLTLFDGDNDAVEAESGGNTIDETITYTRAKGRQARDLKAPDREVIITVPDTQQTCGCGNDKDLIRY